MLATLSKPTKCYIFVTQIQTNDSDLIYRLNIYDISYQCIYLLQNIKNKTFKSSEHRWYLNEKGLSELHKQLQKDRNFTSDLIINYSLNTSINSPVSFTEIPSSQKYLYPDGEPYFFI